MRNLNDLRIGETAVVESIDITGILKRRIIDMGLTKGSKIKIEKDKSILWKIKASCNNGFVQFCKSVFHYLVCFFLKICLYLLRLGAQFSKTKQSRKPLVAIFADTLKHNQTDKND